MDVLDHDGRISRRRFLAVGAVGTAVALLSACGQGATPSSPAKPAEPAKPADAAKPAETKPAEAAKPAAPAAQSQAAPAKTSGSVTLTWITPAEVGPERDFYTGFARDFEKQNPNVKVEVSYEGWADYQTKLPTVLAGGAIPDVIHLHASIAQDYGLRGAVRDMFEYMKKDNVSKDDFFPFLLDQMTDFKTKSKLWAIPKDSAVYAVYYNKDLFDKAGVPYPKNDWSFNDLRETAKRLTVDKNGTPATDGKFDAANAVQWGMAWGNNATDSPLPGSDLWQPFAWAQAGPWFSDDMKQAYFDDPAHVEFVQSVIDMRCKDHSIPQAGDSMGQGDAWRNGLVAMSIGHHSQTFFYKQEKKTFNFDVVFPTTGPKGQFNAAGCSGYTIPVKAQHPDEAWAFIKFLVSPANVTPMVKFKRWGAPIKESEQYLLPEDNIPAHFKEVLYDPMLGQSKVQTKHILYPPYLGEMRQIWKTEYDETFNCGGGTIAEASKRAQPQIQALLDKAWKA
jgi:multiple sugar transport system substrate-binding protein